MSNTINTARAARMVNRPMALALCDFPAESEAAAAAADRYARTDDGGYPGTSAAMTYRAAVDAAYAAAAAKATAILRLAFLGV